LNDERKLLAYYRWNEGGPGDDVVVVANFLNEPQDGYVIGFPSAGTWKLRFNSDWQGYSENFEGYRSTDVATEPGEYDGFLFRAALSIGPYSVLIFSQWSKWHLLG
jgi:1,4-alpha-glucan branching enzyme